MSFVSHWRRRRTSLCDVTYVCRFIALYRVYLICSVSAKFITLKSRDVTAAINFYMFLNGTLSRVDFALTEWTLSRGFLMKLLKKKNDYELVKRQL